MLTAIDTRPAPTVRPGAASVVLSQLEQDHHWPAGGDADKWQALHTLASNTLRSIDSGKVSADVATRLTAWAHRRQHLVRRLARPVRAEVNRVATDHGLLDRSIGAPGIDMAAALRLAGCDPRNTLGDYLDELMRRVDDDAIRKQLTLMRRGLR